jgi:transcriptional regulator with XRE-family HTH domain
LGKEIAYLRKRIGLSQEELGVRAEVHRTYISQLERGLKSPTLSMILKLSGVLKASASKLVATIERQL